MNLFLTRRCDQGCAFCYAADWMEEGRAEAAEALWPALEHYAAMVRSAGEPPPWSAGAAPVDLLVHSAGTVNLLGGEPTAHPDFEAVVARLGDLGLGVNLFTSGAHPERVRAVAEQLWFVTLNGRFLHRAPALGVDAARLCAHLPLRPGDDPAVLLEAVAAAGLRSAVVAFAAPAGGARGPFFTPDDPEPMRVAHAAAVAAAARLGVTLGWDCAPPRCVVPEAAARCLPVPVLDPEGMVSVCGGAYLLDSARRPLVGFGSLQELHTWALGVHGALEARPSPFTACRACPELELGCLGMCLAWRGAP